MCRIYWQPLYAFVRRRGCTHEESQDLPQGFIVRVLEKQVPREFQHERGRFRSFLLASLKNYLANAHDADRALKRGGAAAQVPISRIDLPHDATPEKLFEKQ